MSERSPPRLRLSELVGEGSDLARLAVRECWLSIVLVVAAHTLIFLNQHVAGSEWRPGPALWIAPLLLLAYIPLYGGLYRTALGGAYLRGRGPGGLQWSGVEWRLIAVGVVIVFLIGLAATPFLAVTAVVALIPGSHAPISVGVLGAWSRWAFIATPIWLVFFWIMAPRIARLMLGWPFSIARGKTEPFAGFAPARRSGWPLAFALVLSFLPLLVAQLIVFALTLISLDPVMGGSWPLPQAIGAGVLVGMLNAAVQAPLSVGVLAGAWWLLEGEFEADAAQDAAVHDDLPDDAALAAAMAEPPEDRVDAPADEESDLDPEPNAPGDELAETGEGGPEADSHPLPPIPEPEPPPPPAQPRWGVEPLSPWPHSVLPPWPDAGGFEPPPRRAPLAQAAEPAQAFEEVTELG